MFQRVAVQRLYRSFSSVVQQHSRGVCGVLNQRAARSPHVDLLRVPEQDLLLTSSETLKHVNAVSVGLVEARVHPGKSLAVLLPNNSENLFTFLGAAQIGIVSSFIDPSTSEADLASALDKIQPRGILFAPTYQGKDNVEVLRRTVPEIPNLVLGQPLRSARYPDLKANIHTAREYYEGFLSLQDLLVYNPIPSPLPSLSAAVTDSSTIIRNAGKDQSLQSFTLGQFMKAARALSFSHQRVVLDLDLNTAAAQCISLAAIDQDSLIILPSEQFDAKAALKVTGVEHGDVLVTTPSRLEHILQNRPANYTNKTLKSVQIVSAPGENVSNSLADAARKDLGAQTVAGSTFSLSG